MPCMLMRAWPQVALQHTARTQALNNAHLTIGCDTERQLAQRTAGVLAIQGCPLPTAHMQALHTKPWKLHVIDTVLRIGQRTAGVLGVQGGLRGAPCGAARGPS